MKTSLIFCQRKKLNSNAYVGCHKHNCYELVYYSRCNGVSQVGETQYCIRDHCFMLIKPNVFHDERHFENAELIYIGFSLDEPTIELEQGVHDKYGSEILGLLNDILYEAANQYAYFDIILSSKMNELVVTILRSKNKTSKNEKSLRYSISYLEENYSQKICLQDISDLCGYSYDYFRHQFKNQTGVSPQEYLIYQRLIHAKTLLENSDYTITDVAYQCGFSSGPQFSTMFKTQYGISPKSYQSKNRIRYK